ncbi:RagB/SusD family nutrient uptake outer membrane protein [Ancylomarina sp. YFZ004]
MKDIAIYICALMIVLLSGCTDYLDVKPKNIVVLKTTKDVHNLMESYLYGIERVGSWTDQGVKVDGRTIKFPYTPAVTVNLSLYADNFKMDKLPEHINYCMRYYGEEYYSCSKWENIDYTDGLWSSFYSNIGFFNIVIDALNKNSDRTSDKYKETFCESKMLRTLMFFNIMKNFAPYSNAEYGIPINTDPNGLNPTARNTQEEVYEFLISELKSVQDLDFEPRDFNVFYSRNTLAALFAQIYWFKAESAAKEATDWDNAAKNACEAIEGKQLNDTASKLEDLFKCGNSVGVNINNPSCLVILSNAAPNKNNLYAFWGGSSDHYLPASDDLVSLYDENDIRREAYFDEDMKVTKWKPNWTVSNKVQFWRVADLHLIAAEAYARAGENELAENYLNTFKQSRIPDYTTYEGGDVLGEILNERRKEFCFEFGRRWTDLKRFNKGFTRKAIMDLDEDDKDGKREVEYSLNDDDYHFAFPIPLKTELGVNGNIDQNPGW